MQQAHRISYAEYSSRLDQRLIVEQRREEDYTKCLQVGIDMSRQIHR